MALSSEDRTLDKANVDTQTLSSVLLATARYNRAAKSTFLLARFSTDPPVVSADARSSNREPAIRSEKKGIMVTAPPVGEDKTFFSTMSIVIQKVEKPVEIH